MLAGEAWGLTATGNPDGSHFACPWQQVFSSSGAHLFFSSAITAMHRGQVAIAPALARVVHVSPASSLPHRMVM